LRGDPSPSRITRCAWKTSQQRLYTMQKFAVKLRYDIGAVRNAICQPWSNGQTEGQINRLKMLKRNVWASQCRIAPSQDASPP
jgi:transposase